MCVCVVCVQVFLRETIEERRESCARQLEVEEEEEAVLQGEMAPTIGIRALLIRGGDDSAGGCGRRGGGRRQWLRRR